MRSYNFLFVNYSGYPDYMEYLIADNGLAYLAAVLGADGHSAYIMDYVTVSTAERLYSPDVMARVNELRERVRDSIIGTNAISDSDMHLIAEIELMVDAHNRKVTDDIAAEICDQIRLRNVDCIGIKLWSQPALKDTLHIVKVVKENFPHLLLVGGGPHIDCFLDHVYEDTDLFDLLVYGDGEIPVRQLPSYLAGAVALADIPNIIYRDRQSGRIERNHEVRMNPLRSNIVPDFSTATYPAMALQDEKVKLIPTENSRGCNYQCKFCIHPIKSGHYREKDVEAYVDELEQLRAAYGFVNFYAAGSNTTHRHCVAILSEAYRRGNQIGLSFFQSGRDFKPENIEIIAKANTVFLWVGVETGSQQLSDETLGKRKRVPKMLEVNRLLKNHGIRTYNSYIYPVPGCDESVSQATLELINEIDSEWVVIYPPLIQPRTAWFTSPTDSIEFRDRSAFLFASMYGIEELENKILPPVVTNERLARSVYMNGMSYRSVFFEHVRFRNQYSRGSMTAHHTRYSSSGPQRGVSRLYELTDAMSAAINKALSDGSFDRARHALVKYNEYCTSGSLKRH